MATSKILIDGIGIDLTDDTVTAPKIIVGATAHNNNGEAITGTLRNSYVIDETLLVVWGASVNNDTYVLSQGTVSDEKLILT